MTLIPNPDDPGFLLTPRKDVQAPVGVHLCRNFLSVWREPTRAPWLGAAPDRVHMGVSVPMGKERDTQISLQWLLPKIGWR